MADDRDEASALARANIKDCAARAFQRHHDHYVRLASYWLSLDDLPQYELAMQRERIKLVKPLDE